MKFQKHLGIIIEYIIGITNAATFWCAENKSTIPISDVTNNWSTSSVHVMKTFHNSILHNEVFCVTLN